MSIHPASDRVVLVDTEDREIGSYPKLAAHKEGKLHRAVSVFVFNESGELLLQRRAEGKYHSGGLWSNTCCTHPYPDEKPAEAAARRLPEEMGVSIDLEPAGSLIYRAKVSHDLVEYEYDHLFVGRFQGAPNPAAEEVATWCWMSATQLSEHRLERPGYYTAWFWPALYGVMESARLSWSEID